MAFPLRTRSIPQCTTCLRSYAWAPIVDISSSPSTVFRQQVRGKKKMVKRDGNVTVRLLKNVDGFGKKGSIVPVPRGQMRNEFFPHHLADYLAFDEVRTIRANNVPIERQHFYTTKPVEQAQQVLEDGQEEEEAGAAIRKRAEARTPPAKPEIERLSPERSLQLLDIFVEPTLSFYRQPVIEEDETPEPPSQPSFAISGAAADLLASRPLKKKVTGPQALYGSVSKHDIVMHIRAATSQHPEAARVMFEEDNVEFVDEEVKKDGKVKQTGSYEIDIGVRGAEESVRRTIIVVPQES